MKQKLCRRLEDLEKISAAAAAQRISTSSDYEEKIARLREQAEAWHADPVNQAWLAAQPPEFFATRMREFKAQLADLASGRSRAVQGQGF